MKLQPISYLLDDRDGTLAATGLRIADMPFPNRAGNANLTTLVVLPPQTL